MRHSIFQVLLSSAIRRSRFEYASQRTVLLSFEASAPYLLRIVCSRPSLSRHRVSLSLISQVSLALLPFPVPLLGGSGGGGGRLDAIAADLSSDFH